MEHAALGPLTLEKVANYSPAQIRALAKGIASGLEHLHSMGFVHGILKPENILIGENGEPKISFWGISKEKHGHSLRDSLQVSRYTAPELASGKYYKRSDTYAFGVILWELVYKKEAFSEFEIAKNSEDFLSMLRKGIRPKLERYDAISVLIASCWRAEPGLRPPWKKILLILDLPSVDLPLKDVAFENHDLHLKNGANEAYHPLSPVN